MSPAKSKQPKAVKKIHGPAKAPRKKKAPSPSNFPEHLTLAAGDAAGRDTFFDLDDSGVPMQGRKGLIYMAMAPGATLADYRAEDGKRNNRSMITIPPKLRESLRECFGVNDDSLFPLTTALIALADYGAMVLKRDQKLLLVEPAEDEHAEERKAVRRARRLAAMR